MILNLMKILAKKDKLNELIDKCKDKKNNWYLWQSWSPLNYKK